MRCLYCGKGLALLKRLRGGGDFCSEAHRKLYQQEYTELALSRLMQAKPASEATPLPETRPFEAPSLTQPPSTSPSPINGSKPIPAPAEALRADEPPPPHWSERQVPLEAPREIEPALVASADRDQSQTVVRESEVQAPAPQAGFFPELPVAAAGLFTTRESELGLLSQSTPAAPLNLAVAAPASAAFGLAEAGQMAIEQAEPADYSFGLRATGLELRDFARPAAVVEPQLEPARETGLSATLSPLAFSMLAEHPGSPPAPWIANEQDLPVQSLELGELARLNLKTTGFGEQDESGQESEPALRDQGQAVPQTAVLEEPGKTAPPPMDIPVVEGAAPPVPPTAAPAAMILEPARHEAAPVEPVPLDPLPVRTPNAQPVNFSGARFEAVVIDLPSVLEEPAAVREPEQEPPSLPPPAAEDKPAPDGSPVLNREEHVPGRAVAPLPWTVNAQATGRGRPSQLFSSAMVATRDLQIPRSAGLPLRPLMVLGPAQPKREAADAGSLETDRGARAAVAPAQPKGPPKKPESKVEAPAPRKGASPRKPEELLPASVKRAALDKLASQEIRQERSAAAEKVQAPEKAKEVERPQVAKSSQEPAEEGRPLTPAETDQPQSKAAAAVDDVDLGLPTLHLETQESAWSRLPAVVKLGLAAAIIAAISGVAYMVTSGNHATASLPKASAPSASVAVGSPITDLAWIQDWSPDPDLTRNRRISVLRGSLPLSNYRIEFQAQIEKKAVGWVYRAADPKNYYVNKIEIIRPGIEPQVGLVRYAVIKGQEQSRVQIPLTMLTVRIDTLYQIRFEAVGDRFTTWIGDQKVDEWTDERLGSGAAGTFREYEEEAYVKGQVQVTPLVVQQK